MPMNLFRLAAAAAEATDADLLNRYISQRDEAAFAELVRRHGPFVGRVCRRIVGDSAADDAFQATFLVLACRARSVRNAASVGSWLIGVAGRVSRQMRKRNRRTECTESPNLDYIADPKDQENKDHAELNECAAILDIELTRLPERLRDPVVLCLVQGKTQEQAALELGGSARTIRRRLDRAKAVLRARLERRGIVPTMALGLISGIHAPTQAVPNVLAQRTVRGVFDFLSGGASTPAVILAKGIVM
ncbi:MAG TPA: sigma-70 family RNA polymerase sigma factor, partial [Urbifossiella sp.]